jgi:hypothetical protein
VRLDLLVVASVSLVLEVSSDASTGGLLESFALFRVVSVVISFPSFSWMSLVVPMLEGDF